MFVLQTKPEPLTFDTIKETLETKGCMYMIPCNQFNHVSISEPTHLYLMFTHLCLFVEIFHTVHLLLRWMVGIINLLLMVIIW